MKVLASADHHFCEHKRFAECERIHSFMVDVARRERVDLFLSAGDIYEGVSTPVERRAVAGWLTAMSEICPVVISKGNHDRSFELGLLGRLRTRHQIIVEEAAGVHLVAGAAVAAVAWPDRAVLAARKATSQAEIDDAARLAFTALLLGLREQLSAHAIASASGDVPRIGLGHFMVDGSVVSTGQPLLGMPLNLSLSELALLDAPLVVCGHIHKAQEWTYGDSRILYPGSPFRTDFGQLEENSVVLAEFDGARLASVERIPTPATPMIHVQAEWSEYLGQDEDPGPQLYRDLSDSADVAGAELRLRYNVEPDKRDAAKRAAQLYREQLLERGAISVKIEECVLAVTRARVPELAAATTLEDKLAALWRARDEDIDAARRERLFSKLATLQALQEETAYAA